MQQKVKFAAFFFRLKGTLSYVIAFLSFVESLCIIDDAFFGQYDHWGHILLKREQSYSDRLLIMFCNGS